MIIQEPNEVDPDIHSHPNYYWHVACIYHCIYMGIDVHAINPLYLSLYIATTGNTMSTCCPYMLSNACMHY